MSKYLALLIGVPGILAMVSSPVIAADSGWYAGGNLGRVSTNVDTAGIDAAVRASGAASSATTADETDTGWKLYLGYQFSPTLALEAHYSDLGKINTTTRTTGPAATITGNYDFRAWGVDAVGTMPVAKQFDLFAKLGFYWADTDASAAAIVGGAATTIGVSDDNTGFKFGIGGRYHFTGSVALRAEWEHFNDVGNSRTTGNGSFNFFSLGL